MKVEKARIDSSQGVKRIRFEMDKGTMFDDFSNREKRKSLLMCAGAENVKELEGKEINVVVEANGNCIGYQSRDGNLAFKMKGNLMARGQ